MKHLFVLMCCGLLSGCFASSVTGPGSQSSNVQLGVPGVLGASVSSYETLPMYESCLARYGGLPESVELCRREVRLSSPTSNVWYCNGGYGWVAPNQAPRLCDANGPIP